MIQCVQKRMARIGADRLLSRQVNRAQNRSQKQSHTIVLRTMKMLGSLSKVISNGISHLPKNAHASDNRVKNA